MNTNLEQIKIWKYLSNNKLHINTVRYSVFSKQILKQQDAHYKTCYMTREATTCSASEPFLP